MSPLSYPALVRNDDVQGRYRPCPACGFRLMAVWPTEEHCPLCGYYRNARRVSPGRPLSEAEKLEALRRWLWEHDLNERLLAEHYHLSLDDFFVD